MKQKIKHVLLIDDDEDTNFFNHRLLTRMNAAEEIRIAESGEDALAYLNHNLEGNNNPMLVFLDLGMPGINGWEFLDEYHKFSPKQKRNVRVFILTSSINPHDKVRAERKEEIAGFLNKPLTENKIQEIVS